MRDLIIRRLEFLKKLIIRDFGSYERFKKEIFRKSKEKNLEAVGFGGCFYRMVEQK